MTDEQILALGIRQHELSKNFASMKLSKSEMLELDEITTQLNGMDVAGVFIKTVNALKEENSTLKYNYYLLDKHYKEFESSLPNTHWGYWRKRAGELLHSWHECANENQKLKAQLSELKGTNE